MTTYQIQIDERESLGQSLLTYLQSIPQIVTFSAVEEEEEEEEEEEVISMDELYAGLDRAFADVKLMVDGKKRKKSLQELIDEL
jgi:hypothetical protein